MSNKIKIKRGLKAGLPNLEVGEFGLAIDTNEVFIGTPTGNELVNGGGGTVDWQDIENKPELQEKLIAGDNITIENNVISASGSGGISTAQFDTLVWSSPILTPLGIDKLVIHYAYYDKNPRNIMVTLNAGITIEVPLPVFASYTFAQFSTEFAGAVITNVTEVSPDYEFVVFTEDIIHINPFIDFQRVFDFNSTCRAVEDGGDSGYIISYRASSSQVVIFDDFGEPVKNTLSVGFMGVFAGYPIEDFPILTEIDVGGGGIPDAPSNNKLYGRRNDAWEDITNTFHTKSEIEVEYAKKTELFSGSYNDLTNKPTIPTKTSDLTNDSNFAKKTELFSKDYNDLTNKPTIPTKTSDLTNDSNFATTTYVDNVVGDIESALDAILGV